MSEELMIETGIRMFILIVEVVFFIIGIVLLNNRKQLEARCSQQTNGKVKKIETSYNSEGTVYFPIFEYSIGELKFEKKSKHSIGWNAQNRFQEGQDIIIYYNPNNYEEYYVKEEKNTKILGWSCFIIGLVGIIVCIVR